MAFIGCTLRKRKIIVPVCQLYLLFFSYIVVVFQLYGLLILQIAARHIDVLDFSTGAFIDIQTAQSNEAIQKLQITRLLSGILRVKLNLLKMFKSLPFEFV